MCLILIAWQAHPDYPLVVAANRDEFFARPSAAAAFWPEAPQVLAGPRSRSRWHLVGNQPCTAFRGAHQLPRGWPGGEQCALARRPGRRLPDRCCQPVGVPGAGRGACRRLQRLQPLCRRRPAPGLLREPWRQSATLPEPGIYGLSNHLLDTPWPKLATAKASFAEALAELPAQAAFFDLLADQEIVADSHLPETGVPLAWERILSAVFVRSEDYGTRASTLLVRHRTV
jgi:hypothetical protein